MNLKRILKEWGFLLIIIVAGLTYYYAGKERESPLAFPPSPFEANWESLNDRGDGHKIAIDEIYRTDRNFIYYWIWMDIKEFGAGFYFRQGHCKKVFPEGVKGRYRLVDSFIFVNGPNVFEGGKTYKLNETAYLYWLPSSEPDDDGEEDEWFPNNIANQSKYNRDLEDANKACALAARYGKAIKTLEDQATKKKTLRERVNLQR